MEAIQTILLITGQVAMIIVTILLFRFLIKRNGREITQDYKLALDYILTLIKIKDQYRAYGCEAEADKLDEKIKELLKKIEI